MLSPASTERVTLSKNSRRLVRQDLPLLKPCCESFIKWFLSRWSTTASRLYPDLHRALRVYDNHVLIDAVPRKTMTAPYKTKTTGSKQKALGGFNF